MSERLDLAARLAFDGFALDVALDIPMRGITAIFGPSGSGKSTVLRIIAGLERRAAGHVRFGRAVWAEEGAFLPAHRRPVGLVFQDARLFAHRRVAGNLAYAARRASRRDGPAFEDVVRALDLGPLLDRRVGALSGGERQRVALGRALLAAPRLLLLDEPLSGLDMGRKAAVLPYLAALPDAFGIPALYVSHAVEEIAQLADRVIVMAEGRVRAIGPLSEVFARHDLQDVTGRFEAGAVLDMRVISHDPAYRLTRLDFEGQAVAMPMLAGLEPGERVRLRVRARDVSLAVRRPEGLGTRNVIDGVLETVTPEAESAFAEVTLRVGRQVLRARITREALDVLDLRAGSRVCALVKAASFDRRGLPLRDGEG